MSSNASATPEALREPLAKLRSLFDSLKAVSDAHRKAQNGGPRTTQVLTINGGRGAGKTTLLNYFQRSLTGADAALILGPIEPEFFGPGESIYSAVAVKLANYLAEFAPAVMERPVKLRGHLGDTQTIDRVLSRLIRYSAFTMEPSPNQQISVASLDQYSSDFTRQTYAGESFRALWQAVTESVVANLTDTAQLPIVITVDDADLRPDLAAALLQQMRFLATDTSAVICTCLDINEVRFALQRSYERSVGVAAQDFGYAVVDAQLLKALPERWRLNLHELSPHERLTFCPIGDSRGFIELLHGIKLGDDGDHLQKLFRTRHGEPTQYAECLPSLPREMESLYYRTLDEIDRARPQVIPVIVEACLSSGYRKTSFNQLRPEVLFGVQHGRDANKQVLRINFAPISYQGVASGTRIVLRPANGIEIGLGDTETLFGRLESNGNSDGPRVDNAITLGLVLAREFTQGLPVFDELIEGGQPIRGGRGSELLNIKVDRDEADKYFLVIPPWPTYSDYFGFDKAWSRFIARLGEASNRYLESDPPYAQSLAVLEFLRLVARTQLRHDLDSPEAGIPDTLDIAPTDIDAAWSAIAPMLGAALEKASSSAEITGRDTAYLKWVRVYLPMCCHPILLPPSTIELILSWRRDILTRLGRRTRGDAELELFVYQRLRGRLGESWCTPLYQVFDFLGSDRISSLWFAHVQAAAQRNAQAGLTEDGEDSSAEYEGRSSYELNRAALTVLRAMHAEAEAEASKHVDPS